MTEEKAVQNPQTLKARSGGAGIAVETHLGGGLETGERGECGNGRHLYCLDSGVGEHVVGVVVSGVVAQAAEHTFLSSDVSDPFSQKLRLHFLERQRHEPVSPQKSTVPHRESAEWSDATPREPRQPGRGASRRSRLGRHVRVARGGGVHARALRLARSGESVCESELHIGSSDDRHGAPTVRELTVELGATVDELVGGVVSGECTYALARSPLVQPERYAPRRVQEG